MSAKSVPVYEADLSTINLPAELNSLAEFIPSGGPRYRRAAWLRSDFDDRKWEICLASSFTIDWCVPLGSSGTLLTDPGNRSLLDSLRSLLIVQTHPDATGRFQYADRSAYNNIRRTIAIIDYLLLRADALLLSKHGLSSVSEGQLKAMLGDLSLNAENTVAVYDWPGRLATFIRAGIHTLTAAQRRDAVRSQTLLTENLPDIEDRVTSLSSSEIVDGRIWLWLTGQYRSSNESGFLFAADSSSISRSIYKQTIGGRTNALPIPHEFSLGPDARFTREYPRASVTMDTEVRRSRRDLSRYIQTLSTFDLLRADGLAVPVVGGKELRKFASQLELKAGARFRTLPYDMVLQILRQAIEFCHENGDQIVDAFISLDSDARRRCRRTRDAAVENFNSGAAVYKVGPFIVNRWSVDARGRALRDKQVYFSELRSSPGICDLYRILLGAAQLILGVFSARRVGELIDLSPDSCLDTTASWLAFHNRKSGIGELREIELRPIPPICTRVIEMLQRLHASIEIDTRTGKRRLFAPVKGIGAGFAVLNSTQYATSLDYFCDFVEAPLNSAGERHYIRQHQLRRWFAMLFFWGNSFGGAETLRWFLGHTDMEHLYHYITEVTPGETLRGVAAEWAVEAIRSESVEVINLKQIVFAHFGITEVRLLEEDKALMYVEDLLARGDVRIEPEFLESGRRCQICVSIRPKDFHR